MSLGAAVSRYVCPPWAQQSCINETKLTDSYLGAGAFVFGNVLGYLEKEDARKSTIPPPTDGWSHEEAELI